MSTLEKMKVRILSKKSPNDLTTKEVQNFLKRYGFVRKHVNGSHFIYEYPTSKRNFVLNIPMHSPVKPWYIDKIREAILEIEEGEKNE